MAALAPTDRPITYDEFIDLLDCPYHTVPIVIEEEFDRIKLRFKISDRINTKAEMFRALLFIQKYAASLEVENNGELVGWFRLSSFWGRT